MAVLSLSPGRLRSAFSLVELLVACGVVAIFSATLVPYMQRTLKRAESVQCTSNWRIFGRALYHYTADHDGTLPKSVHTNTSDQEVQLHLLPYLCPEAKEKNALKATANILCPAKKWGYGFNSFVSESKVGRYAKPGDTIYGIDLCAEGRWLDASVIGTTKRGDLKTAVPKPHLGQVGVLWLDGHATLETVSKLSNAQVTRDSPKYQSSDETTFIGQKKYDR